MKIKNKKRILAFVVAFTVLVSGVISQWSFLARAAANDGKTWTPTAYEEIASDKDVALRFVVASDIHINDTTNDRAKYFKEMFASAYSYAEKDTNHPTLDAVVLVGDIVNTGTTGEYANLKTLIEQVNVKDTTQILTVMGNHEWWNYKSDAEGGKTAYLNGINAIDAITTKEANWKTEINGYTFLGMSQENSDTFSTDTLNWMNEQVDAAAKGSTKPIFTFQHLAPNNTVYGSKTNAGWDADGVLNHVYDGHQQVINFSGHSHAPINTPTAINQTTYTQYTTGTLYYMELDGTATYGAQPAGTSPTAEYTIVEVYSDNTVKMFPYDEETDQFFKTLDGKNEQLVYEIDVNDTTNWKYTVARTENNQVPVFSDGAVIAVSKETYKSATIKFPQATDDTGVYAYDITCTPTSGEEKTYRIYSEWYFADMPAELTYTIPGLEAGKTYTVSVVPVDFFGETGTAIQTTVTTETETGVFNFSLASYQVKDELIQFVPSNTDYITGTYYKIPVTIDGTTKTYIVASKQASGYLAVWMPSYLQCFTKDLTVTTSIEIQAGAVLQEISMTTGYPVIENGDSITVSEDFKLLKGNDGLYIEAGKNNKATFGLKAVYPQTDGTAQIWITSSFKVFETYGWAAVSFTGTAFVDGAEKTLTWTIANKNDELYVNSKDEVSNDNSIVVIPKGTLLTPTKGNTKTPIEIAETFCLVKINGTWTECYNTNLEFKAAGSLQVQLTSSCDALTTYGWAGKSLQSNVLVDGVEKEAEWIIDIGMIWINTSKLVSGSSQKIVIPEGTLLTPTEGQNKRPLYVMEDLVLVKLSDNNWYNAKDIIDVTYNKLEKVREDSGALDISFVSTWTGESGTYSGTVYVDGTKTTVATFWMNANATWHSIAEGLKDSIKAHKTVKIEKGTIFTCSGKKPMRFNADNDLYFTWNGTTYVEGLQEETVNGKYSAVLDTQLQFCSTANFGSAIKNWETSKNTITIQVDGKNTEASICYGVYKETNTSSYFWLQGSAVKEAIVNGSEIKLPTSAVVEFTNEKITFHFASNMTIAKLGQGWAMYTGEHTYPNGDNKFYYNIDNGTTYKLTSSNDAIYVKELPTLTTGDTIGKVGAYNITRIEDEIFYKQLVILYKNGDASEDGTIDITDLVAMKKTAQNNEEQAKRLAGIYAADMNRDGKVDDDDLLALRRALLNKDAAAVLMKTKGNSVLNGVMPIVGFGVYDIEGKTTGELYDMVKDLGINTVSFNDKDYSTTALQSSAKAHLQAAEERGIGIYVQDNHLHQGLSNLSTLDEKITAMAKRVGLYSQYKSFLGTYVVDEPTGTNYYEKSGSNSKPLSGYQDDINMMKQFANLNTYVNLLPYYSSTNSLSATEEKYKTYLEETFQTCGLDILSYDNYPVGKGKTWYGGSTKEIGYSDFYTNLRLARKSAAENGSKPFWVFAQAGLYSTSTSAIDEKYLPTKADQQWEISASLACGAKGIQYFSVVGTSSWTANGTDTNRAGLIKADGTKNNEYSYYDAAKETNQFVASVDHVLMNAEHKGVLAKDFNAKTSLGDMVLSNYKEVSSVTGDNALVGCFDYYEKTALLVVNCNTSSAQDITLNFSGTQSYEMTDYACTVTTGNNKSLTINIHAGQCALVVLN